VKNEGFWTSHLASKQHLSNIASAKKKKADGESAKRPAASAFIVPPEKRQKSKVNLFVGCPKKFFDYFSALLTDT